MAPALALMLKPGRVLKLMPLHGSRMYLALGPVLPSLTAHTLTAAVHFMCVALLIVLPPAKRAASGDKQASQ
jgi:hypothetical protein